LENLYNALNNGEISKELVAALHKFCDHLQKQEYGAAISLHKSLSTAHWDEVKGFTKGLKFLVFKLSKR